MNLKYITVIFQFVISTFNVTLLFNVLRSLCPNVYPCLYIILVYQHVGFSCTTYYNIDRMTVHYF